MSIHLLTRINLTPAKAEPDRATVVADNLLKARKSTNIALIGLFAAIDAILLGFFLSKLDGKDDLPLQLLLAVLICSITSLSGIAWLVCYNYFKKEL